MEKTFYANSNQKTIQGLHLYQTKIDLISKTVKREEGQKSITVKLLTNQEDITIKNMYICKQHQSTQIYKAI